ncbi:MAG: LacI family transcriptional regulator [Anaerolineae bacterium]|nr:LacI family transcriptional regulator [Anaerolineae bacterium]
MDRVKMADVAREAGVSAMTVSRVINGKGYVSDETRRRVLRVIERLGYRPSGIARGLATRRTGTIGLVVPDVANPFFADVARGVEESAYAEGYNVFLCNTDEDPQRELAALGSLEERQVDGLILCSSRLTEDELHKVVARHTSFVLVNRRLVGARTHSVLLDDEAAGRLATQHLLRIGRRAVGLVAGPETSHSGQLRAKGYRAALAADGLPYYPEWVRPCAPTASGGRQATLELLSNHPELTGLVCYNDLVAVGALQAAKDRGCQVPADLAIVGHDDIPLAALVTPALTTCRMPRYELGTRAVGLLLEQLDSSAEPSAEIVLSPELVVRASAPGPPETEP